MADTTFIDKQTLVTADWLNIVNDAVYNQTSGISGATARPLAAKLGDIVSVKDFGAVGNGVTDDTAAIQAAIDTRASAIYFPSGVYIVTSLTQRIRQTWFGGNKNLTTIRQSVSMLYSNTPFISMETGVPSIATPGIIPVSTDISEGASGIRDMTIYVTSKIGFKTIDALSNCLRFSNIRMWQYDGDVSVSTNYYTPTAGTIGFDIQAGTGNAFLPAWDNVEVRCFDTGWRLGAVINDFNITNIWAINCRKSFVLQGNSVGYINGCIETNVTSATGIYFIGASSSGITWEAMRFEMTAPTSYAVSFDPSASASLRLLEINPCFLIAGGGGRYLGIKPTGFQSIGFDDYLGSNENYIETGNSLLRLPPIVKPYTSGSGVNTSYKFIRADGVEVAEITWASAGDLLTINNKNGGSSNFQVNGVDYFTVNNGTVNFANHSTTTLAPSAGGASALPATPLGYMTVNINGTPRKVAYY